MTQQVNRTGEKEQARQTDERTGETDKVGQYVTKKHLNKNR